MCALHEFLSSYEGSNINCYTLIWKLNFFFKLYKIKGFCRLCMIYVLLVEDCPYFKSSDMGNVIVKKCPYNVYTLIT